jgi:flagellar motor switch protein FliM
MFGATPDCAIEIRCASVPMYTAKMGRRGSRIAVQIEDRIERNREG